jgi:hypothetical protein
VNNHARRPALGEMVHLVAEGTRCRAAIVTEVGVGGDGRQTALTVFVRGGLLLVDATHDEDASDGTWHHEH